jgi:predicted RNase H-like HicB family nuclease
MNTSMTIKREFTAVYQKHGKWVIAWIEEVPGANTQGRTMKEAKENLVEALTLVLEENRKLSALKNYDAKRETFRLAVPA